MIKEMIYVLIILIGILVGLFLAKICKEEIKQWKRRLIILITCCLIAGIFLFFTYFSYKIPAIVALGFMIITFLTITLNSK